jgi:uncharacterized protein (TIGR02611 family)
LGEEQSQRGSSGRQAGGSVLDQVEERLGFRAFFAKHPWLNFTYRAGVALLGAAVMVLGFVLIPLPGPGWLIVFFGLAILATEFAWAERLLAFGRHKLHAWTDWVLRQSLLMRGLIGIAGLVLIAVGITAYIGIVGLPDWLPLD